MLRCIYTLCKYASLCCLYVSCMSVFSKHLVLISLSSGSMAARALLVPGSLLQASEAPRQLANVGGLGAAAVGCLVGRVVFQLALLFLLTLSVVVFLFPVEFSSCPSACSGLPDVQRSESPPTSLRRTAAGRLSAFSFVRFSVSFLFPAHIGRSLHQVLLP